MDFSFFDQFKATKQPIECDHEFVENCGENICKKCYETRPFFVTSIQQTVVPSYSPYQRKTHIKSTLTRFIASESFHLPEIVMQTVQKFSPQTLDQIRILLKQFGYTKYYKHVYAIASHCGLKTATLTQSEYEKIVFHFNRFNTLYSQKNSGRNMIQYSFLLNKLFQFIGRSDLCSLLKITKNKQKLTAYESIWNDCFTSSMSQ